MITKDTLKENLRSGERPATELLYNHYAGMLFSYILQFEPDKVKANGLLASIFSRLSERWSEACDSHLSIYCWLQSEARMIILSSRRLSDPRVRQEAISNPGGQGMRANGTGYIKLLEDASPEHRWVFREVYIHGRRQEELAKQANKDTAYIGGLLRESLVMIRKKLT